ncbi:FecR family protein [Arcticibacter tournemirensis]|uniref:DUF4974 domain-containing protein n=1 Tax=Arcticibacter tournemirensis TaxID=699437 RepID=A0A5M9H130_9SPHI|nr:FecR domain-containing protein [Arcticibacter tournemirensis]KAA8479711.1 DUF4974 domain-containing protein [Arcticibacter tournemirensis]TQM50261.1 FecR family protein [Arcticibacter tournemirensis]
MKKINASGVCVGRKNTSLVEKEVMETDQYLLLYEKYLAGKCTPEEEEQLFSDKPDGFTLYESFDGADLREEKERRRRVFQQIRGTITRKRKRVLTLRMLYAAAASVALILLAGIFNKDAILPAVQSQKKVSVSKMPVIKPGSNAAVLTLSDGSVIHIDESANGLIASEGKTHVRKLTDGRIIYETGGPDNKQKTSLFNTISIPRAGQYNVTLPDGTQVWLNSESTLIFPVAFTGRDRRVRLKGEAYFEVANDAKKPFMVETETADIEVLGTHFNVRAYPADDAVYATLLEGAVKLNNGRDGKILSPGEQGISLSSNDAISVRKVRVSDAIAWKNGLFVFRDNTVREIMEQVARWYDVEIEFQGNVEERTFGGVYSKNRDLAQLLASMELTGLVHFKAEGRRIIVMP